VRRVATAAAMVIAMATSAAAEVIRVEVTEVAGGRAYLVPGADAGLRPGDPVRLAGKTLRVIEVTRGSAVVDLDGAVVTVGARGQVDGNTAVGTTTASALPPVRPAEAWRAQWPTAQRPAAAAVVAPVPLGSAAAAGRLHAAFALHGVAHVGEEDPAGELAARAVVSYQLLAARPLSIDVDGGVRLVLGDGADPARAPVRVRAAQLRYGEREGPGLALGRLRHAAAMMGPLDGARAAVALGPLTIAAFGGLSPDPTSDRPDPDDVRFGTELVLDLPRAPWRPVLAVTAAGSSWLGQLDERRLTLSGAGVHGHLAVDAWAELQAFPASNPWAAGALEVTGAGAGARWRRGGGHASVGAVMTRPERSRRLEALLGREWLCAQEIVVGAEVEPCRGGDLHASAHASGGQRLGPVVVEAGAGLGTSRGVRRFVEVTGFVRAEVGLPSGAWLELGGSGGRTSFVDWGGATIGLGRATGPGRRLELSGRYRPELFSYVASAGVDRFLQHTVEAGARVRLDAATDAALEVAGSTGADRDVVTLLTSLHWRPRP
jgi:hypothetical protein